MWTILARESRVASKCLVGHLSWRTARRGAVADEPTRTTGEYQESNRKVVDLLKVSSYTTEAS